MTNTPTHIVLPLQTYQILAAWMRKQPFENVVKIMQFVQTQAIAATESENGEVYVKDQNDGQGAAAD